MSRYIRPIHKFITKPTRPKIFLINPVEWLPKKQGTHYTPETTRQSKMGDFCTTIEND